MSASLSASLIVRLLLLITLINVTSHVNAEPPDIETLTKSQDKRLKQQIEALTTQIKETPDIVGLYSQRGDAYFYAGEFKEAVADYSKMVELNPQSDVSHWRRGIAYFYANQYDMAAGQFDRYHSFDNVDRENGIWRYLSHYKSKGADAARKELLKYDKDDREPFGDVYQLFSGTLTGKQILDKIESAEITENEREKRMFYASLYVGLYDAVEGRSDSARKNLTRAAQNTWAPKAGYGPHYMWQVARLHALGLSSNK